MTDKIDAATCRCCGRTALFDQVKLKRIEVENGVDKWQCEAPCEKNKRKIRLQVADRNGKVRNSEIWTNSLLERLSCRLSTRTSDLETTGEPSKLKCPKHYAYDVMIPLAHAAVQEPLGWLLFGAKYLHRSDSIDALVEHTATRLVRGIDPEYVYPLSRLSVGCYCTGLDISERQLRRDLDIGRGSHRKYHEANHSLQALFHATEDNYAREVKRFL